MDAGQGAFVIDHSNTFVPVPNPVTPELYNPGLVITPEPDSKDQVPVPETGLLPASVVEVTLHKFWVGPALETVGVATRVMVTVEVEAAQGALDMVHLNMTATNCSRLTTDWARSCRIHRA